MVVPTSLKSGESNGKEHGNSNGSSGSMVMIFRKEKKGCVALEGSRCARSTCWRLARTPCISNDCPQGGCAGMFVPSF